MWSPPSWCTTPGHVYVKYRLSAPIFLSSPASSKITLCWIASSRRILSLATRGLFWLQVAKGQEHRKQCSPTGGSTNAIREYGCVTPRWRRGVCLYTEISRNFLFYDVIATAKHRFCFVFNQLMSVTEMHICCQGPLVTLWHNMIIHFPPLHLTLEQVAWDCLSATSL